MADYFPKVSTNWCIKSKAYWRLMRFDKPIGIFLLLWPAMWALWISGNGHPDWLVSSVIVAGVIIMRAAGCVINDYADKEFDPHVERTRLRPIAAGEVTPKEALLLFVMLCVIAFGLVLMLNPLTVALSFVGAFLAASYPFMKRFTQLPQAYLGVSFGWAVPMTFAAHDNLISGIGWELFGVAVLWALIYDTMYAMVDRDDDLKIGVKSTAILFGVWEREIIAGLQVLMIFTLWVVGYQVGLGATYKAALGGVAILFFYQQSLIFNRDRDRCFSAFLNNHWVGAVVFLGLFADYLAR